VTHLYSASHFSPEFVRVFVFSGVVSGVLTTKKAIFVLATQTTAAAGGEETQPTHQELFPRGKQHG
jgi:hypothetical protein